MKGLEGKTKQVGKEPPRAITARHPPTGTHPWLLPPGALMAALTGGSCCLHFTDVETQLALRGQGTARGHKGSQYLS